MRRRLSALLAIVLAPGIVLAACNSTKTVAIEDDDDSGTDAAKPDVIVPAVDTGTVDIPDTGTVDEPDAGGFKPPECTGLSLSSLTSITRIRVHPDGSLYLLTAAGNLLKYTVNGPTGDAGTDAGDADADAGDAAAPDTCSLARVAAFAPDHTFNDFDFDANGDLFTLRLPTLNSAELERRDPTTGASTGLACDFGGDSNAYWGHLGVSPDGTKAAVVSSGTSGNDAGSSVYAYTLTIGATCTSAPWAPNVGTMCNGFGTPGILSQAVRADSAKAYIACAQIGAFPFAATTATYDTSGITAGHIEDVVFGPTFLDATDSSGKQVIRFDRTTGAFVKTFSESELLGAVIPANGTLANLLRIKAMSDPNAGKRYVALTADGVNAYRLFRIDDF